MFILNKLNAHAGVRTLASRSTHTKKNHYFCAVGLSPLRDAALKVEPVCVSIAYVRTSVRTRARRTVCTHS